MGLGLGLGLGFRSWLPDPLGVSDVTFDYHEETFEL